MTTVNYTARENYITTKSSEISAEDEAAFIKAGKRVVRNGADGHGWKFVDENGIERIRYMYPQKDARWAHERTGYFRRMNEKGQFLDMHGNVVEKSDPLFHVKTHIIPEN